MKYSDATIDCTNKDIEQCVSEIIADMSGEVNNSGCKWLATT